MRMGDCNVAQQGRDFIYSIQEWMEVFDGIAKLKERLQEKSEWPLTAKEYASLHETILNMCKSQIQVRGQTASFGVPPQLYQKYNDAFAEYIDELVLPVLEQKPAEFMLRELVNQWNIYKKMDHYLSCLFAPLDQYYTTSHGRPAVRDVGLKCFYNLMHRKLNTIVRDAVISLFDREHNGEQIDLALRKNVLGIFVEIGMGKEDCYGNDFESAMVEDTAACCFWEAVPLILKDCPDYRQKAEECWRRERERLSHYLRANSMQKLFRLELEFLTLLSENPFVKEHSGCHPLLQDGKHVTDEGTTLVKQAEDAASNKKSEKRDIVGPPEQVLPVLRQKHDEFILRELVNRWNNHKIMVRWLSRFLHFLDHNFTSECFPPVLHDVGLICFCDLVYQELKTTVRDAVISLIDWEREGEQIDRALLKNVLGIFVEIGMGNMDCYENDFESTMLENTAAYYSQKAASWIMEDSCPDYMQKAEECLKREKERVGHYLHANSEQKLLGRVEHELLSQYENQLLEKQHSGCHSLLQNGKMDDLSRMYRLFCRIPKGLETIAHFFKQHVTVEGTTLVKQAEDAASNKKSEKRDIVGPLEQKFVWEVIELHDKYLQYVSTCFVNHSLFHKALKEAFEVFCNKGVAGSTSAELLATFCDNILKKGSSEKLKKGSSEKLRDEDIEETLEKVVKLLAYIGDKDLYSGFYRKKLARRLIFDKSANDEHERSILTKLKQQFGRQFTSKMEGMLTDLTLARENQPKFQKYLDDNAHAHPGIDLTVTVLTTGFWPSYKSFDLNLPAEMVKCVEVFKEFYQTENKHRKLTWIYSLGTCHLSGNFNDGPVELIVTTYQGAALLLFNNAERLSYSEIKSQLNLSDEDIIRLLHSLACLKHKILIKEPNTKPVTQSDYFDFNANFTDKSRKIKIPLPPVDEKKKIIEDVDKDRRYAIDACIVRIMKSRKVLAHAQLVTECVEQLGRMFKPEVKAIKKRMEDLITREYLERDKNNPNMFRYLA